MIETNNLPEQNGNTPLTQETKITDNKPICNKELPNTDPDNFINNLIFGINEMTKEVAPATNNQRIEKSSLGKVIDIVGWMVAILSCAFVFFS